VNEAVVLPAGTVTLEGTVATAVLLLATPTTVPPEGAAAVNVTVAVEVAPAITSVGLSAIVDTASDDNSPEARALIVGPEGTSGGWSAHPTGSINMPPK